MGEYTPFRHKMVDMLDVTELERRWVRDMGCGEVGKGLRCVSRFEGMEWIMCTCTCKTKPVGNYTLTCSMRLTRIL